MSRYSPEKRPLLKTKRVKSLKKGDDKEIIIGEEVKKDKKKDRL